jgi:hypothetical protein
MIVQAELYICTSIYKNESDEIESSDLQPPAGRNIGSRSNLREYDIAKKDPGKVIEGKHYKILRNALQLDHLAFTDDGI